MVIKIQNRIVDYKVVDVATEKEKQSKTPNEMSKKDLVNSADSTLAQVKYHENFERPEMLEGKTYKIKTPLSQHAIYVTINDIVFNPKTKVERRRPYEVFINSKNMEHFQWTVALTRIISAVFRKGGDSSFLVEEMEAIFDPRGGYFRKGGKLTPSLVAEIGSVLRMHMENGGMIETPPISEATKKYLAEKQLEYESQNQSNLVVDEGDFPPGAQLCYVCNTKAMIYMDGCMTCLNCGESKCS